MSVNYQLTDLQDLFHPFLVRKFEGATVAYKAAGCEIADHDLIDHYAYAIDTHNEAMGEEKTVFAERYGGDGLVRNGGGVRCALVGAIQVKGIGANSLLGLNADPFHSDGHLSFEDALYEAIWGEIFGDSMPYGAVKAIAVIHAHAASSSTFKNGRALLLREGKIRPAHFERAIYFKPSADIAEHRDADVRRVRNAIKHLPSCLPRPKNVDPGEWAGKSEYERFSLGLSELASRYAVQAAFAKSLLIFHAASPSNITVDGEWLDFTSIFSLHPQDFDPAINFRNFWSGFWDSHAPLVKNLVSLNFYANKYLFGDEAGSHAMVCALSEFSREYQASLIRYFLCYAGLPLAIAEKVHAREPAQRWGCLFIPFFKQIYPRRVEARQALPEAHRQSANQIDLSDLSLLSQYGANAGGGEMGAALDQAYQDLKQDIHEVCAQLDISIPSLRRALFINERRFIKSKAGMEQRFIRREISAAYNHADASNLDIRVNLDNYFCQVKDRAALHFSYDRDFNILMWQSDGLRMEYDMINELIAITNPDETRRIAWRYFPEFIASSNQFDEIIEFYGDGLIREFSPVREDIC